jgi:hypothetical protein
MESRTLHSQHLLTRTIGLNANVVVAMASCGGCSALVPVLLAELWPQLNVISQMDAHHAAQAFMLALEGGLSDMEAPWTSSRPVYVHTAYSPTLTATCDLL